MGALFLVVAGSLHYKGRAPRLIAVLMLLSGASLAGLVATYLPGLVHMHLFGASVMLLIAAASGIFFWEETFKNNGRHASRTPLVGFVLGVSAVLVFAFAANLLGSVNASAHNGVSHVTTSVGK